MSCGFRAGMLGKGPRRPRYVLTAEGQDEMPNDYGMVRETGTFSERRKVTRCTLTESFLPDKAFELPYGCVTQRDWSEAEGFSLHL